MKNVLMLILLVALVLSLVLVPTVAFAADGAVQGTVAPMPAWAWTLIIIGIIVVVILLIYFILPKLLALAQKKGIDVSGFLTKAGFIIAKTDACVENMVALGAPLSIVDMILDYAATGVKYAEQLLYSSQITDKDERGVKAREAILTMLRAAGVPEEQISSDEVQALIKIGVEAATGSLGHKSIADSGETPQG